jgi:hypothetical protein
MDSTTRLIALLIDGMVAGALSLVPFVGGGRSRLLGRLGGQL